MDDRWIEEPGMDGLRLLAGLLAGKEPAVGLDGSSLLSLARRQGVSPFLYHVLRDKGAIVATEVWQGLRGDYYDSVALSLVRERPWGAVLDTLAQSGVRVAVLKGMALARTVYPFPALRTMSDLDLLVPSEQLAQAKAALISLGYTLRPKADRPEALHDVFGGETQMFHPNPQHRLVELHTKVFPGEWMRYAARVDEASLWERSVELEGTGALCLSPEDMVLHVCAHFAVTHQLGGVALRPLLDLERLRRSYRIDWQRVAQRARLWRISFPVWLVLDLLARFFGDPNTQLPLAILAPEPFRRRLLRRFSFARIVSGGVRRDGFQRFFFQLSLIERPVDGFSLLLRAFFPERKWLQLRYRLEGAPTWRVWLQRVWHPIRVLVRKGV